MGCGLRLLTIFAIAGALVFLAAVGATPDLVTALSICLFFTGIIWLCMSPPPDGRGNDAPTAIKPVEIDTQAARTAADIEKSFSDLPKGERDAVLNPRGPITTPSAMSAANARDVTRPADARSPLEGTPEAGMPAPASPPIAEGAIAAKLTAKLLEAYGYAELSSVQGTQPIVTRLFYRLTKKEGRPVLSVVATESGFTKPAAIDHMALGDLEAAIPEGLLIPRESQRDQRDSRAAWRVHWHSVSRIFLKWSYDFKSCHYYVLNEEGRLVGSAVPVLPQPPVASNKTDATQTSIAERSRNGTRAQGLAFRCRTTTVYGAFLFPDTHHVGRLGDFLTAKHFTGKRKLLKVRRSKCNSIHGIDGIYVRRRRGMVREIIIVETKTTKGTYKRRQLSRDTIRKQCRKLSQSEDRGQAEIGSLILRHLDEPSSPVRVVAELVRHRLNVGLSVRQEVDEQGKPIKKSRKRWGHRRHLKERLERLIGDGKCWLCDE